MQNSGFDPGLIFQPPSAINGINLLAGLIPGALLVLATLLFWILCLQLMIPSSSISQFLPDNAHKNPYGDGWSCDRGN